MRNRPVLKHACAVAACALAVGLGGSHDAFSQSLIEALSSTYNSNPDLLASRATLRQTDETLTQAVSNWRPKVSLSVEYNRIEYDGIPVKTGNFNYQLQGRTTLLTATQPLFRGGKTVADTKVAQANIQAQRAVLADTERNVLLSSVQAYADLLQDTGIVDVRRNNVRVLVEQLNATRERFRVGELTITDVSQAEARLEQSKADLVLAQAQARIDEAAFQHYIGIKPSRLGDLALIGGLPASEEECVALAMDGAPLSVSAQHRITAASYGVTVCPHWFHDLHVHLVAATPNARFVELFPDDQVLNFRRLVDRQLEFRGGKLLLPTEPGLGFGFDAKMIEKYALDAWA